MMGMDILLKSFGIDPAEMLRHGQELAALVQSIKLQLDAIHAKVDRIERQLGMRVEDNSDAS